MRIHVDDAGHREQLAAALAAAGCAPLPAGESLDLAPDEAAATRLELEFFLAAWRLRNPDVAVDVS
jgi:hypothetical protein